MPAIPPARTAAPDGFDAAIYPDLPTVTSTDRANVLNLDDYGQPFEHYLLPDLAIAYFTLFTDKDQTRILFVNSDGKLIGDITDTPLIFPMGAFMVTPDAYYAVTAGGVSARQMIEDVGPLSAAQLETIIRESTLYRSFAPTELPADDPDRVAGRTVYVLRHTGIWKRAVSTNLKDYAWKSAPFHNLDAVYKIPRATASGGAKNFFGSRYRVELTHFDQQEFLPERSAPMGSTTGVGRSAQWAGTGYYTVFIDNVPALRFRIENDREELSGLGPGELIAEGSATLDFVTLTRTDNNGKNNVIVVSGR